MWFQRLQCVDPEGFLSLQGRNVISASPCRRYVLDHLESELGDGASVLMAVCRNGKHEFIASYRGLMFGDMVSDSLGGLSLVCKGVRAFDQVYFEVRVACVVAFDIISFCLILDV